MHSEDEKKNHVVILIENVVLQDLGNYGMGEWLCLRQGDQHSSVVQENVVYVQVCCISEYVERRALGRLISMKK